MSQRKIKIERESWPLALPFTISRGTKTAADVLTIEIAADGRVGRGECVPYPRYGETVDDVAQELAMQKPAIEGDTGREALWYVMAPGAARNAIDAALWDLEAKTTGEPVWQLAELPEPKPALTAQTISIGSAAAMAEAAAEIAMAPLIKIKLDAEDVVTRVAAVREAAPGARLITDANEAWNLDLLKAVAPALTDLGVEMIEQPLPADDDDALAGYRCPVLLCADESCHTSDDIARLGELYGMVNIKLDKTGGLTEALNLARTAEAAGIKMMIGCMVGTSLAMAPAVLLAPFAEYVDLDGPLLLKEDRPDGLLFKDGYVHPPTPKLWG
jgi:L-alanine-DL-glutamate epimerase-like enolase superfamily enzyme